jgi:membrane associated rhomboid family serine protease
MSYYRYSNSSYHRPSFFGGFRYFPTVIRWLLISNVAVWLLVEFILRPFVLNDIPIGGGNGLVTYFLALWPLRMNFYPWQLVTYMFLHGGFMHLLFNMFALWMFGMELENVWGSRKFLLYYTICGVGAGISNLLIGPLFEGVAGPTVGASGAIYGVLIAFGMMFPDRPIFVYFLLPIRARYFVLIYIGIELFYGVTGTADHVAHFAHLGGAAVGFVYLTLDGKVNLLPGVFGRLRRKAAPGDAGYYHSVSTDKGNISDARFYDIKDGNEIPTQQQIDEILDKISQHGYQSLTDRERQILFEASKKMN